jgi:hypothetical protein
LCSFKWQPINRTKDWEVGFEELVDYTNKHDGSCVVPKQKKKGEYASLYAWVSWGSLVSARNTFLLYFSSRPDLA